MLLLLTRVTLGAPASLSQKKKDKAPKMEAMGEDEAVEETEDVENLLGEMMAKKKSERATEGAVSGRPFASLAPAIRRPPYAVVSALRE